MKKLILVISAVSLAMISTAVAAEKKAAPKAAAPAAAKAAPAKSFAREYGMAGCGLGSIVMGKEGAQLLAATTNGTAANQTFAITFGTSNCIDSETATAANRMDRFVVANKVALAGDIARGQGEALSSLSVMLKCSDSAKFNSALQNNFSQIFPSYDISANRVTDSIITVIQQDEQLSQSCSLI